MITRTTETTPWSWLVFIVALVVAMTLVLRTASVEPQPASNMDNQTREMWIKYWEASLRLAEADLKVAEYSNARVKDSVSKYDVQRIELQREFYRQARLQLDEGFDFGEIVAGHAALNARLAELDVESMEVARETNPGAIADVLYQRALANAEVARMQAELASTPAQTTELLYHLHGEAHRSAAEILELHRRVSHLEEMLPR